MVAVNTVSVLEAKDIDVRFGGQTVLRADIVGIRLTTRSSFTPYGLLDLSIFRDRVKK